MSSITNLTRPALALVLSATLASHAAADTITVEQGTGISTIQAGIDFAFPDDTVVVKAGTYREALFIPAGLDGLSLIAKGKVIIDARGPGGAGSGHGITVRSPEVSIRGFTIRNPIGHGIEANGGASQLTVMKCDIVNTSASGVVVTEGGNGLTVERCTFRGINFDAIYVKGPAADVSVRHCSADQVELGNMLKVASGPSPNLVFENNTATNCNAYLVEGVGTSSARIHKNRASNTRGVRVSGDDVVISANKIVTNPTLAPGIVVSGDRASIVRNHVTGGSPGILAEQSNSPVVSMNVCIKSASQGIVIGTGTQGGDVFRNTISNSHGAGVHLDPSSMNVFVIKNRVSRCGGRNDAGILIEGHTHRIERNRVERCAGDGVRVAGEGSSVLAGNRAELNGKDGFDIQPGSEDNLLKENLARGNAGEGFENSSTAGTTRLRDNIAQDNHFDYANDGAPFELFIDNKSSDGTDAVAAPGGFPSPEID